MKHKYDIIIVGAGFIGLTLSLMLSKSGLKVCLIEKKKENSKRQQNHSHISGYEKNF